MTTKKKACRAMATDRPMEIDERGGCINFQHSRNTEARQQTYVMRRARVTPAVARTIAALAFENRRAWR